MRQADAPFMPKLLYVPGGTRKAGELIQVRGWEDDRLCGPVKQVAKTYSAPSTIGSGERSTRLACAWAVPRLNAARVAMYKYLMTTDFMACIPACM